MLRRIARLAVAAPASVPGACAWAVTVAPVVWGRAGVPKAAQLAAAAGLLSLAAGAALERRLGSRIRSGYLLGFTAACAVAWVSAGGPRDLLLDDVHTAAGAIAWAVFALSWAAAPLKPWDDLPRVVAGVPRTADELPRGAWVNAALGVLVAVVLQLVAVDAQSPERALLVRLVSVAGGLIIVGACTEAAVAQYRRRRIR
jgi:hypothetical protein